MKKSNLQLSILKQRIWILGLLLPVLFLLGLGSGWFIWGRNAPAVAKPQAVRRYEVPVGNAPATGPENAPITIVEFSDYQCPYCVRWHEQVYGRIMEEYKDKVRFVYRDFPLVSIHPDAQPAAEAAHCAGEQNAYWPFHEALFSNKYGLGAQAYQQYATELGLDLNAFNTCITERRFQSQVEGDIEFAYSVDVRSTPTFFVNGLMIVGAQPYEEFKRQIDAELAGAAK